MNKDVKWKRYKNFFFWVQQNIVDIFWFPISFHIHLAQTKILAFVYFPFALTTDPSTHIGNQSNNENRIFYWFQFIARASERSWADFCWLDNSEELREFENFHFILLCHLTWEWAREWLTRIFPHFSPQRTCKNKISKNINPKVNEWKREGTIWARVWNQ